jgi:hypothetical protein
LQETGIGTNPKDEGRDPGQGVLVSDLLTQCVDHTDGAAIPVMAASSSGLFGVATAKVSGETYPIIRRLNGATLH